MTIEGTLAPLNRLVGSWITEVTHPAFPGVVVHGTVDVEWLEGERFVIHRARFDHRDFPDSIAIIGVTEHDRADTAATSVSSASVAAVSTAAATDSTLTMHYFDSRGVFRVYGVSIDEAAWRIWRNAPGFSQRFTGTFADADQTIDGLWELREDDVNWASDLRITYRRRRSS